VSSGTEAIRIVDKQSAQLIVSGRWPVQHTFRARYKAVSGSSATLRILQISAVLAT
jgi:hypothetical protein